MSKSFTVHENFVTFRKRAFFTLWAGQLFSMLGSSLTNFSLGVWLFLETGSVSLFVIIALCTSLPSLIFGPAAGVFADRFPRKWVIILADAGAALGTVILVLLVYSGKMAMGYVYAFAAFNAICSTFQGPAYSAAVTMLVPKTYFKKIGGVMTMAPAIANISGPPLAGFLYPVIGLQGIFIADLLTFAIAAVSLMFVRIPDPKRKTTTDPKKERFWPFFNSGLVFIRQRRGLMYLLGYFVMLNICIVSMSVLLTVMMLSFSSPGMAGTVISMGGIGMLLGSICATYFRGAENPAMGMLNAGLFLGLGLLVMGLRPSVTLISAGFVLMFFSFPTLKAYSSVIWRSKVPADMQGRVSAANEVVIVGFKPLLIIGLGPLVDLVLNPLLLQHGGLADSVGQVIGVGPGRGIAFLFVLLGTVFVALSIALRFNPHLRDIDTALPDQIEVPVPS